MFRMFASLIALLVGYNVLKGNSVSADVNTELGFYLNHILEFVRNILTRGL